MVSLVKGTDEGALGLDDVRVGETEEVEVDVGGERRVAEGTPIEGNDDIGEVVEIDEARRGVLGLWGVGNGDGRDGVVTTRVTLEHAVGANAVAVVHSLNDLAVGGKLELHLRWLIDEIDVRVVVTTSNSAEVGRATEDREDLAQRLLEVGQGDGERGGSSRNHSTTRLVNKIKEATTEALLLGLHDKIVTTIGVLVDGLNDEFSRGEVARWGGTIVLHDLGKRLEGNLKEGEVVQTEVDRLVARGIMEPELEGDFDVLRSSSTCVSLTSGEIRVL